MIDRITSIPDLTADELSKRRGKLFLDKEMDCTGAVPDSSSALQAIIDNIDNRTALHSANSAIVNLASPVNIIDRQALSFISDAYPALNGSGPSFRWNGLGGGLGNNVCMFNILHSDRPMFSGINFDITPQVVRSTIAVANGTTTITATDGNFVAGAAVVGAVARIVKAGIGQTVTRIVSVGDAQTIVVADAIPFSATGCTLYTGKALDGFLNFDGEPGTRPGTLGRVQGCTLNWGNGGYNRDFKAISISATAQSNHENYTLEDIDLFGTDLTVMRSAELGVTNGTTTVGATDANFPLTDIGKRALISYADGVHETTIVSRPNAQTIVLADAVPFSVPDCRIHTGEAYGMGNYLGPSQNSKHHTLNRIRGTWCSHVINAVGGSFRATLIQGYGNDIGVRVAGLITETSHIIDYANEDDLRGIDVAGNDCETVISSARCSIANMRKDGFFSIGGKIRLEGTGPIFFGFPASNARLIHLKPVGGPLSLTSIGNKFGGLPSWDEVGYNNPPSGSATIFSVHDENTGGVSSAPLIIRGLPINPTGLEDGHAWSDGGVLRLDGLAPIVFVSTSTELVLSYQGRTLEFDSATPVNLNVSLNSVRNFPVGASLVVLQRGAGQVTPVPAVGVTIHPAGFLKTAGQWKAIELYQSAIDEWVVIGGAA